MSYNELDMDKVFRKRLICVILIAGVFVQNVSAVMLIPVSYNKNHSPYFLYGFSEITGLFLALQNNPKTKLVFSLSNECSCNGFPGYSVWQVFYKRAFKADTPIETLNGTTTRENLHSLNCQFLI